MTGDPRLGRWLERNGAELIEVRRHLHAAPELGREEHGTTDFLAERLDRAGLAPQLLPGGSGLWVDVGTPVHNPDEHGVELHVVIGPDL